MITEMISTNGSTTIEVFDCVKNRNAESQHDDRGTEIAALRTRPTNSPTKTNRTMAALASFLCPNTPRQFSGQFGLEKIRALVNGSVMAPSSTPR